VDCEGPNAGLGGEDFESSHECLGKYGVALYDSEDVFSNAGLNG